MRTSYSVREEWCSTPLSIQSHACLPVLIVYVYIGSLLKALHSIHMPDITLMSVPVTYIYIYIENSAVDTTRLARSRSPTDSMLTGQLLYNILIVVTLATRIEDIQWPLQHWVSFNPSTLTLTLLQHTVKGFICSLLQTIFLKRRQCLFSSAL